jgi:PAS domain S-box-containing protein
MNLGLLEVDHQDVIIRANESFCKHSGYGESEMIGKKAQDLFMAHPQNKLVINQKNGLRKKGVSDRYQMEVRTKEGELRWWLISGAPNYDTEGNQIGSIGIHLDITDHKNLESELEKAKCKAEEYAKAKETFLANMSHEIRTPLNAIIGMLRELGRDTFTPRQQNFLRGAQTGAQHLLSIISNVLDMSKIEAGELHLEDRHFSLQQIVEETVTILEFNTREKLLSLTCELDDSVSPAFIGDPTRLRQILINIISNSIKFTHEGGVSIEVRAVALSPDKQEVHLTISDTGIGMEQEYLNRLFRPFSQEDISTARQYGGTGLGMAITYELIRLMGGEILVNSQKGVGTTMDIQLPLLVGEVEKTQKAAGAQDFRSLQTKAILLVEDNEMNRVVARNTLDHYGIQVSEAGNGQLALETLQGQSFDLILMDLQMPVMGGLEATRHIRDTLGISTPIIALSANAFKKEIELCLNAGMNDYVTKPYEEKVLLEAIAKHIHGQEPIAILPEATEAPPPPPTEKLYDLSQMESISRGEEGFIQQMIGLFLEELEESLPGIEQGMATGDLAELYTHSHRLKPVLANMGITKISAEILEIERQTYHKEAEATLPALVETVCVFLKQVREQLNERLTAGSSVSS